MSLLQEIRKLVSKKKKRFEEDGFDLDLSCMFFLQTNRFLDITGKKKKKSCSYLIRQYYSHGIPLHWH